MVLTVFQNRRWDSDFLTIQKIISEGKLGKLKEFESRMDRWRPRARPGSWREQVGVGSGTFFDLGSHLIDQTLVLFGTPQRIYADVQRQQSGDGADDYFHAILFYDQLRAILHSSSFSTDDARFRVFGEIGCFSKRGADPQEAQLKQGMRLSDARFGQENSASFGVFTGPAGTFSQPSETGRYREFYERLLVSLRGDAAPPVTAESAMQTIRVLELAYKSSQTGRVLEFK